MSSTKPLAILLTFSTPLIFCARYQFEDKIQNATIPALRSNPFQQLSHGIDIIYSEQFARGGSISAHKDNEMDWGLVFVFSLGQDRWLRVRKDSDRKVWHNVLMHHNSLVAMYGPSFQRRYTHQIDKLYADEPIGTRFSLNIRFTEC